MKYFVPCLLFFVFSCSQSKNMSYKKKANLKENGLSSQYLILRIDSNYEGYIIYAKRNDSIFKIVSIKDTTKNCMNLFVNSSYDLKLLSWFGKNDKEPNVPLNHIHGMHLGGIRVRFDEDSIVHDLFYDERLRGLCFPNLTE